MRYLLLWPVALVLFANVASAHEKSDSPYPRRNPVVDAVQKTKESIVTIKVSRPSASRDVIGTGVIIDERGFILTNRHVIGSAQSVRVRLSNGTESVGEVFWKEAAYDLAVLRIRTSKKLQALELAPVADLMVGETVITVGHPFGYTNTISTGIVSALGREITMPEGEVLTNLIQTNASINPGNSGGPLLNINGELIGINVALREGAQGIAFALNAEMVKEVLSKYLSGLKVSGVTHGLRCRESVQPEGFDRQHVIVEAVAEQ